MATLFPYTTRARSHCRERVDDRPAVTRERQPCHRTAFEQQHQRVTQRIRIAGPGISGQRTQATADFGLVFADDLMAAMLFFTQFDGGVTERTRSEEHTSELQSLMRKSYAVFC